MQLDRKNLSKSDKRRYEVDYTDFLCDGRALVTTTVTVPAGTNATISGVAVSPDKMSVVFFVTGGAVNESFTATVQVTTTDGEIVNDTVDFVLS